MNGAARGDRGTVGRRTQAEREAATVETMYAVATAAVLGAVGFLVVTAPVMAGVVHGRARSGCVTAAMLVAAVLFFGRIVLTLLRFERRARQRRKDPWYPWDAVPVPETYGDAGDAGLPPVARHRPRRVVRRAASSGGKREESAGSGRSGGTGGSGGHDG
ncbi:hypothetical protein SAMN05216223_12156 [Actinacidiphila yanglinensis]|uniref:Uncharacterized protein n=1 Tax=Actinacidiphila yanglinensis TaxID=310779 RepID=A0A1H6DYB6_9ACTN|nr:DUF6332 family protein [Actinacidiphila yanglinensis]SEG90014.1 hypothetical protein SAMN05216223_12156 [Actinacidiphila yanglinensis]